MCKYCEDKSQKELLMLDDIWGGLVFNPDTARLEEKHISEDSGKTLITRVVEIDYCPFCGKRITPLELNISGSMQVDGITAAIDFHLNEEIAFEYIDAETELPSAGVFIDRVDDYGVYFSKEQGKQLYQFFKDAAEIYNS